MRSKAQEIALSKTRKRFARGVAAGHGKRRDAQAADLRSRNAYRLAAGLPLLTQHDKGLTK